MILFTTDNWPAFVVLVGLALVGFDRLATRDRSRKP